MSESGSGIVNGVRLFYRIDGPADAPVVVFANSLGLNLDMWEPQVAALSNRFRVVRYDTRGHGRSDVPSGPYTLEQMGNDLLALLDTLAIAHAHLCGLSLGGMIALWMVAYHPDRFDRVVFANTAAKIGTEASWTERIQIVSKGGMAAIRDVAVARFLSEAFRAREPAETRRIGDMLENTSPDGYVAACAALRDADLRVVVSRIRLPSLIIAGSLDEPTPPAQAQDLHATVAGSELAILTDAAHLSNIERPAAFNDRLLEFLCRP